MTERNAGWHVADPILRAYAAGSLDTATTWSVEVHVPNCPDCRRRVGGLVDADHLAGVWQEIEAGVDSLQQRRLDRLLTRLGLPGHLARLLAATPSLRLSWLLAVALALTFGVAAAHAQSGPGRSLLFLTLAPLVPLAGVAAAYGPGVDPGYEIGLVAPMHGIRLLLIRVTAVLASTVPVIVAASLLLPDIGLWAAGWLLPAFGLALGGLAVGSVLEPLLATSLVAAGWVVIVVATVHPASGAALPFTPAGQLGCAGLTVAAGTGLVLARRRFDAAAGTTVHHLLSSGRTP
jgi:hypothetical protein